MVRGVLKSAKIDGFENGAEDALVLTGVEYVYVVNTWVCYWL